MGPAISDPVKLQLPAPHQKGGTLYGQVVSVDHFGNLITNIHRKEIEGFARGGTLAIRIEDLLIEGMRSTYAESGKGEILGLFGSSGYLEIAVNQGRAADRLGLDEEEIIGLAVEVSLRI